MRNRGLFGLVRRIPEGRTTEFGKGYVWILNENSFGLMLIADFKKGVMRFVDSYNLEYYEKRKEM